MSFFRKVGSKYKSFKESRKTAFYDKSRDKLAEYKIKQELAEEKAKLTKKQSEIESYKSKISKYKQERPNIFKNIGAGLTKTQLGVRAKPTPLFQFKAPPRTDMWGRAISEPKKVMPTSTKRKRRTTRRRR